MHLPPSRVVVHALYVRSKYMSKTNPYEGLFPGDYFIQRINIEGDIVHAYGFLRGEDHAGNIYADYQCSRPPTKEVSMDQDSTKVVGRINVNAYKLAKLRGWPDEDEQVLAIIAYSGGRNGVATLWERMQIRFMSV
jgi:hypothetical protein